MKKIKWALCDDASFFSYIYSKQLEAYDRLSFCGYCSSGEECLQFVMDNKPDVLLLDVQMERETAGIDIIPELKKFAPNMKIIMLTSFNDDDYIYTSIASGADNYILKENAAKSLGNTIIDTYDNKNVFSPEIANILVSRTRKIEGNVKSLMYVFEIMSRLSSSEYEILKAIYNGQSYKDIASSRFVSEGTVRNHISRILKKFDSPSMSALIKNLKELNLFDYLK